MLEWRLVCYELNIEVTSSILASLAPKSLLLMAMRYTESLKSSKLDSASSNYLGSFDSSAKGAD